MRYVFFLLSMSACSASLMTSPDAAADIEIVREILLEQGRFPAPNALTRTARGDYVIAGHETLRPWATRVDAEGRVKWRHVLEIDRSKAGVEGSYEAAAAFSDDSTLLCGSRRAVNQGMSAAILTHIDAAGNVLSHREVYPEQDTGARLNHFYRCVPWAGGAAILGNATRLARGGNHPAFRDSVWLLALDARGEVRWERLFSNIPFTDEADLAVLANQDLAIVSGSQITVVNGNGSVKQREIGASAVERFILVRDIDPGSQKLIVFPTANKAKVALKTFDYNIEARREQTGPGARFVTARAYLLKNEELVLFGHESVGETSTDPGDATAGVSKLTKDLRQPRSYFFRPLWVSTEVTDALPTDQSNGFVTLRSIHPIPRWPEETRMGVVMTFIKIN